MIHLDSSFLIDALVPGSTQETRLAGWLAATEAINVSALAWGEFLCGPLPPSGEAAARRLFPSPEPLLAADAELAARLFNATGRRSRSFADCAIAAVAIRMKAQLATSNIADFLPLTAHGLRLA